MHHHVSYMHCSCIENNIVLSVHILESVHDSLYLLLYYGKFGWLGLSGFVREYMFQPTNCHREDIPNTEHFQTPDANTIIALLL